MSEGIAKEQHPLGTSNSKLVALWISVQTCTGYDRYILDAHRFIKCAQFPAQERWSRNNCRLHLDHTLFLDPGGQGSMDTPTQTQVTQPLPPHCMSLWGMRDEGGHWRPQRMRTCVFNRFSGSCLPRAEQSSWAAPQALPACFAQPLKPGWRCPGSLPATGEVLRPWQYPGGQSGWGCRREGGESPRGLWAHSEISADQCHPGF